MLVSVAGGVTGSVLLLLTPNERFTTLVPYLMLGVVDEQGIPHFFPDVYDYQEES